MNPPPAPETSQGAFSLVEVTLALGVAAFCLIAILGLLPVGLNTNQIAAEQTAATGLAAAIAADLRRTPRAPAAEVSPRYRVDVAGLTAAAAGQTFFVREGGDPVGSTLTADARYRVSLSLKAPAAPQRGASVGRVVVSWPAAATKNPGGSVEAFIALSRN